jgi:hypothetical protein
MKIYFEIAFPIYEIKNVISDGNVPINTIAPVISGTALVGNTLTSTSGTWTSDTGVISFGYQWTRDNVDIVGATSSTYTLVSADRLKTIRSKVRATDSDGTSGFVNSNSLTERTIENFKVRVSADSGLFEAESCLITTITNLNNI